MYYSALVGLIDAAKCGGGARWWTTIPARNACAGSLDRIEQAFREVGLRGVLCYETSDRNGPMQALEGIREKHPLHRSGPEGAPAAAVWWRPRSACTLLLRSPMRRFGARWK